MRRFLLSTLCILITLASRAAAADHPNIVIVLADDQGWGDLSANGNSNLSTPSIDSLANDGARFSHFFVCPVCSPTRAELLTGRYHPRGGVFGVSTGGERLNLDETTIADTFKAAGYATACFGKWHNGTQYPYHPNGRGFEEYYGFCSGHWGDYFDPPLEHNGKLVRGNGYLTDDLTDHALDFIRDHQQTPFLCYLAFNTPHSPMQVPESFWEKQKDAELKQRHRDPALEDVEMTRAALAMCENIDWNVGRILGELKRLKLAENTIIVYLSDNGPNSWRWNGGMKGRKGSTDEGGVRSPLFVRWPGRIPAGSQIDTIAGAIDLLPTLASLAGVSIIGKKPLDGVDLAPWLRGEQSAPMDRMLFSHWNNAVSVRTQRFRLDHRGMLFDMTKDPGQVENVAAKHPDIARQLAGAVKEWRGELLTGLVKDRPFTVGYPEFPSTVLPARDGVAHGKIQRSARAPNCSYFTNWTRAEDYITWEIDVHTPGTYEATVYYTCPKEDIGSTIQLKCGDGQTQGTVSQPHDPPLRGGENDRIERQGESYVKDFAPLALGTIELSAGVGTLKLSASSVPGDQVMDVRAIVLRLKE